jgi:hypothetical protein
MDPRQARKMTRGRGEGIGLLRHLVNRRLVITNGTLGKFNEGKKGDIHPFYAIKVRR